MQQNYFALLEINQQYNVDKSFLHKQYIALQKKYHPDNIADSFLQHDALEKSIALNNAYKILQDDYLRAEYLLTLNGYRFDDESLKQALTHDELEAILQEFEDLDQASPSDVKEIYKNKLTNQEELVSLINEAFENNKLQEALDLTIRLKYLTNLVGNIKQKIKILECK